MLLGTAGKKREVKGLIARRQLWSLPPATER